MSGLALPGSTDSHKLHEAFAKRGQTIGLDLQYRAFPVIFWDLFGEQGHPVRATVAEMGPLLLSRLLELTEPQEGVLNVAFRLSDEEGLPLLDLKDLQALLVFVGRERRRDLGRATAWSPPAIDRRDPAAAAGAGKRGRRAAVRRTGAGSGRPDDAATPAGQGGSTSWRPTS